jgi:hypothetical protein
MKPFRFAFASTLLVCLLHVVPAPAESLIPATDFSFDMGTRRQNWTHARWQVIEIPAADWSRAQGLEIEIESPQLRRDASVTLAIREADGSWYSHANAADLSAASSRQTALFRDFAPPAYFAPPNGDFKDENGRLDLNEITAIAVGVVNPLGVGEVNFRVTALRVVKLSVPAFQPVSVSVTGRLRDVNGTNTLPAGVFGAFNLKSLPVPGAESTGTDKRGNPVFPTLPRTARYRLGMDKTIHFSPWIERAAYGKPETPILVNSVGDRTQPSYRFSNGDWREKYEAAGRKLGENTVADGRTAYVEFWNEPYLNWANENRKNFDPAYFDRSKAVEGGDVHSIHDGEVLPHLKWTQDFNAPLWNWTRAGRQEWRRGRDDKGNLSVRDHARLYKTPHPEWRRMVTENNPPDSVADGESYTTPGGKTFSAFTPWHVYDETQFTFWSGKGMIKAYNDPLLVYASAAKASGGDNVKMIAGWGNRPGEDHWAAFHMLYQPTIDAAIGVIDGYNDHDYGSDPLLMPAQYEVLTGYGVVRHNKWLHAYNTETASNADPQAVGGAAATSADPAKFTWVSRKIAAVLALSPDKCRALAHFGIGGGFWSDGGEGVAMDLLRNLRGRLVQVRCDDPDLHIVSAIDGTDPLAPRPADLPARQELVTLLLNNGSEARSGDIEFLPPLGTRFSEGGVKIGKPDWNRGVVEIDTLAPLSVTPERATLNILLPPGIPVVVTLALEGMVANDAPATVFEKQYFGDVLLRDITPEAPLTLTIAVPDPATAKRVWFRFVAERLRDDEAELVFNGSVIPLPAAVTPENTSYLRQVAIDPALLKTENTLELRMKDPKQAGFFLGIAGLRVEREVP